MTKTVIKLVKDKSFARRAEDQSLKTEPKKKYSSNEKINWLHSLDSYKSKTHGK